MARVTPKQATSSEVASVIQELDRTLGNFQDWLSKNNNRADQGAVSRGSDNGAKAGMGTQSSTVKSTLAEIFSSEAAAKNLLKSNLTKMAVDSATKSVQVMASDFGEDFGIMMSSALSGALNGAIEGAAMGGIMAPVGAAVGTLTGLVNGATQIAEKEKDAFANLLSERYLAVKQEQADSLGRGSGLAAQSDVDRAYRELGDVGFKQGNMTDEAWNGLVDWKLGSIYAGKLQKLEQLTQEIEMAAGEAYNEERMKGLDAQIQYLERNGEAIKAIKSANAIQQAAAENDQEKYIRKSQSKVLETYKMGGIGEAEAGRQLEVAKMKGEAAYRNSDDYRAIESSEKQLIEELRTPLNEAWKRFGYDLAQSFHEGFMSDFELAFYNDELVMESVGMRPVSAQDKKLMSGYGRSNAFGLSYVPHDNFYAVLHQGERVLTAAEARSYDSGVQVSVTGNSFVVREEADIDRIAKAIAENLTRTQAVS